MLAICRHQRTYWLSDDDGMSVIGALPDCRGHIDQPRSFSGWKKMQPLWVPESSSASKVSVGKIWAWDLLGTLVNLAFVALVQLAPPNLQ
jgi:hypothetical protein